MTTANIIKKLGTFTLLGILITQYTTAIKIKNTDQNTIKWHHTKSWCTPQLGYIELHSNDTVQKRNVVLLEGGEHVLMFASASDDLHENNKIVFPALEEEEFNPVQFTKITTIDLVINGIHKQFLINQRKGCLVKLLNPSVTKKIREKNTLKLILIQELFKKLDHENDLLDFNFKGNLFVIKLDKKVSGIEGCQLITKHINDCNGGIISCDGYYNQESKLAPLIPIFGIAKIGSCHLGNCFKTQLTYNDRSCNLNPINENQDFLQSLGAPILIPGSSSTSHQLVGLGCWGIGETNEEVEENGSLFLSLTPYKEQILKAISN